MTVREAQKSRLFDAANVSQRRRIFFGMALPLLLPACGARIMRIHLNISVFNYLERPIFDVNMNGIDLMSAPAYGFYGANGLIAMQPVNLGLQIVSWKLDGPEGMDRNGEMVKAKNYPSLNVVPSGVKWLGLHIYPDDTVEIKLSNGNPDELQTERGMKIIRAWESKKNER